MPIKHYKHGGSTAARQINCPGWTSLAKDVAVVSEESEYAKVGTALHTCMELILHGDTVKMSELVGMTVEEVEIDADHFELIDDACSALEMLEAEYTNEDQTEYLVEKTFELNEDIGGTADLIVFDDTKIDIVDWKFGQGVEVSPKDSAQGMFYAMIAAHEMPQIFEGRDLYVTIIQPMPSRGTETLKRWKVPAKTFAKFKREYMASINQKTLSVGKHCQFCPCAPLCPKKTGVAKKALLINPDQADSLNDNLKLAANLKTWCDEVLSFGHNQLDEGLQLKDWKLVPKRATRKWSSSSDLTADLLDGIGLDKAEIYGVPKIASPAQVEKLLKAKKLDLALISDYIIKESSGTTLAPADDPREGVLSVKSLSDAIGRLT